MRFFLGGHAWIFCGLKISIEQCTHFRPWVSFGCVYKLELKPWVFRVYPAPAQSKLDLNMKLLPIALALIVALTGLVGWTSAMPDPDPVADPDPVPDPSGFFGGGRGYGSGRGHGGHGFSRGFGSFGGGGHGFSRGFGSFGRGGFGRGRGGYW
ncbi:uncharacterized protein LOC134773987 [Penaeus indicus]|uniref:uncharacterized protein LOC134773987 n=2 Tax=Penaeus indicus TaxID=29960 RepID=UPI00300C9776